MRIPMITAHSGCEQTLRDSMDSLVRAVDLGAPAAEIDVRMDETGVMRMSHDKKESQAVYEACVTIEQIMAFAAQNGLALNCDMKEPGLICQVLAMAKKYAIPRQRLWITGAISAERLIQDPDMTKSARFFLNIEEILKYLYLRRCDASELAAFDSIITEPWKFTKPWREEMPKYIGDVITIWRTCGAEGLNLPHWALDAETARQLSRAEVPVSVWTVDKEEIADRLLSYPESSIVNITTRQVQMIQRKLQALG